MRKGREVWQKRRSSHQSAKLGLVPSEDISISTHTHTHSQSLLHAQNLDRVRMRWWMAQKRVAEMAQVIKDHTEMRKRFCEGERERNSKIFKR